MQIDNEFATGLFIGINPATGIVAAKGADALAKKVLGWDPVQGDTFHWAPAGSVGGGGTRRHLFDRPMEVTGTGIFSGALTIGGDLSFTQADPRVKFAANYYIKLTSATGVIDIVSNTITALSIANNGTTITSVGQITAPSLRAGAANWASLGQLRLPNNNVIAWRNTANSSDFTLRVSASDRFALDAGLDVAGTLLPTTDNALDFGSGSFRWRNASFSGTAAIGGSVGIGVGVSGAVRLSVKGASATSADYAAEFANSAGADILLLRDDLAAIFGGTAAFAGSITVSDGVGIMNRTGAATYWAFQTGGVTKALVGVASAAGELITGSVAGDLAAYSNSNILFSVNSGSSIQAKISSAGHFLPGADNSYDHGSASFRWRSAWFAGAVLMGSASQVTGGGILKLGTATSNAGAAAQFLGWSGGQVNWQIDTAYIGTGLNFTPSTGAGGSTFTTPAMSLSGAGNLIVNNGRINSNDSLSGIGAAFQLLVAGVNQGGLYNYSVVSGAGTDYTPTIFAGGGMGVRIATNGSATIRVTVSTAGTLQGVVDAAATQVFEAWNKDTVGNNVFSYFFTEGGSGTLRGSIDYNRGGGVVRYNTTSDGTLKTILGDADPAESLTILRATRLRSFAWKDDESQKPQIGPIAQELYEIFKGAVSVGGMRKGDRGPNGEAIDVYHPWAVDKTAFAWHLVAGWQDHDERISKIERALAARAS